MKFDCSSIFFFQAEDGIRDLVRSRGLGDVYKRQEHNYAKWQRPEASRSHWVNSVGAGSILEWNTANGTMRPMRFFKNGSPLSK